MPVRVEINETAIAALARDPRVIDLIRPAAERIAAVERAAAPVRTGAGAASIKVWPLAGPRPGWVVAYDRRHSYMGILNDGGKGLAARRFIEGTAARFGAK